MSHLSSHDAVSTVEVLSVHVHGASFAFGDSTLSTCEGRGIKYEYNMDVNNVIIILSFQHG